MRTGLTSVVMVMLIGSASLIVAVGSASLASSTYRASRAAQEYDAAVAIVGGCVEEALLALQRDPSWGVAANTAFTFGGGTCTVSVTVITPTSHRIDVLGVSGNARAQVRLTTGRTADDAVIVAQWLEGPL